jgi:quercetin dioxygenase-like cupin family protein
MYRVREQDLPFRGLSYNFVGANHGSVNICAYLLRALPGQGPGPHRHPYDEVQFVREGRGQLPRYRSRRAVLRGLGRACTI